MLVIPDIHGRTFWKAAKNYEGEIVFLGDYLDPYDFEYDERGELLGTDGFTMFRYTPMPSRRESCIENLKEIIEFAKSRDNVTLLIGNHDLHYIHEGPHSSRYDLLNAPNIRKIFADNKDLFKYFYTKGSILFTHAGLTEEWLKENYGQTSYFEALSQLKPLTLFQVSDYRGGTSDYSSPVWLDVSEALYEPLNLYTDDTIKYQIFGHTMQIKEGSIVKLDKGACIDSRRIFEVDPENPKDTLKVWKNNNFTNE